MAGFLPPHWLASFSSSASLLPLFCPSPRLVFSLLFCSAVPLSPHFSPAFLANYHLTLTHDPHITRTRTHTHTHTQACRLSCVRRPTLRAAQNFFLKLSAWSYWQKKGFLEVLKSVFWKHSLKNCFLFCKLWKVTFKNVLTAQRCLNARHSSGTVSKARK